MSSKTTDIFGVEPVKLSVNGSGVVFNPAVPGNWSPPPSNTSDALDQLAASIKGNVMLAILSDPYFNNTLWYPSQFISVDSSNKSYSTGFWNNLASYTPSAASEVLSRFTVKLSAGVSVATNISIWVKPLAGAEYDTGVVISINAGDLFAQNTTDTITLSAGDEIKFTTDNFISVQSLVIYATRK